MYKWIIAVLTAFLLGLAAACSGGSGEVSEVAVADSLGQAAEESAEELREEAKAVDEEVDALLDDM